MDGWIGFFDADAEVDAAARDVHGATAAATPTGEIVLVLRQVGNEFQIARRFGYWDPAYDKPFIVPRDPAAFRTDLASIPPMFAWLVPGLGSHLPAVLLHDGLIVTDGEAATHDGPSVTREEADRIFRDAMKHLGTPFVRRWLIWTAVALATMWVAPRRRAWWRALMVLTGTVVVGLGGLATLDLLDVWDVLPWMGDRPWWAELGLGAACAVGVPAALAAGWGRRWRIAAITGVAVALLLHVTLAVVAATGIYWVLERIASARENLLPNVAKNLENAAREAAEAPAVPAEPATAPPGSAAVLAGPVAVPAGSEPALAPSTAAPPG
ncbi:DUF1353 domain-containing protein [Frankia sp. CNm7]|uniref:DUF1353 domain-containing protein n=1 Tax=Frankia nepalensis TaxID=1836974 RepID=A0A937RC28_9ACTN|nr:DUF1353 domain-containing protein [Frankia nepalensis]MBL7501291.1 DUF1353 domain-containing protein [Frankia nepalensis]MBL7510138.1 DUF1353 domain-containing protein [Frankia nepalensis]MBL7520291.1 DUF1353 domain-containing protein [Frankia nepalensis]MBL7627087.1 DUF1353 domain-containing protein [Frankia nepalensis]